MREREGQKIQTLVVTGEGGDGGGVIGMLGRRRVTPGWADNPVRRQDGRRR